MELLFALGGAAVLSAIAWGVAAVGWVLGVVEAIAVWRLARWAFRIGVVALTRTEEVACPVGLAAESINVTGRAKYRVIPGRVCLFRRRYSLFEFRWNTPLEIKGTMSWSNGRLSTEGRYPLGVSVFFGGWLAGWTIGGLLFLTQKPLLGVAFLALGWVVGAGMMLHSRVLERRRFLEYAAEVSDALRGTAYGR